MIKVTRNVVIGRLHGKETQNIQGMRLKGRFGKIGFSMSASDTLDIKKELAGWLHSKRETLRYYNEEMRKARTRIRHLNKMLPEFRRGIRQMAREIKAYKDE